MFFPIVRSAQRVSTRNWAHSSSCLASLQIADAKCNTNEQPPFLVHNKTLSSASNVVNSVAVESKFEPTIMKNHFPNILEDHDSVIQETNQVDIYHHFQSQPEKVPQPLLTSNQQLALKKFNIAEEMLMKDQANNKTAIKWLNDIKMPLLNTVRARTSSFIDNEACCTLINEVGDIDDPSTVIVIGNPGAGILSHQFVMKGAKQLVLFENNASIRAHLEKIHKNHPVCLVPQILFGSNWNCKNSKHALKALLESERYSRIKIIHAISSPFVAKAILTNYTAGLIPFNNKRVEMFLVFERAYGEKLAELEMSDPQQKLVKFATAWRTFIKSELVYMPSSNAFFPPFAPIGYGKYARKKRAGKAVVLRCTFRPMNCYGRNLNVEERYLYSIFIQHIMTNSTARVINSLEKWIPGIGIRLIREGITVFAGFNQLSRKEFERIFLIFLEMMPLDSLAWKMMSSQNNDCKDWFSELDAPNVRTPNVQLPPY